MLEARIEGAAEFKRVVAKMRAEGNKDLSRTMQTALTEATKPVQLAIKREAEAAMPSRGGYRAVLSKSLRWRTSKRASGQSASFILRTYAEGKRERRDIRRLELGELRHPLFGRRARWYVTSVRPGFHERGTDQAMGEAQDALSQVVEQYARKLVT